MMMPHLKKTNKTVPNIFVKAFQQALILEYDGKIFDALSRCPKCKSKKVVRFDKVAKTVCKVITDEGFKDIKVDIKRYKCRSCNCVSNAESPFYPSCSYGKPLVDLILFLSAKNPYNRVESIMLNYGIQVDRDTVKNYTKHFKKRIAKLAGIKMFDEDIGVNLLKAFFNVNNVQELKKKYPQIKGIESVSDEVYPAKKGAKEALKEENKVRRLLGEDEKKYPDGFTVAVSYLPAIKSYASLIVNENPFNSLFAKLLGLPLLGADYNLTDGHRAYTDFSEHEGCLVHKSRNLAKKDKVLKKLEKSALPGEIKEYLHQKYLEMKKEVLRMMGEKHPHFIHDNDFKGALTTNAIEGGNWRIRFELRTPYKNINSISARTILITIMDSVYNFRGGKPNESFAHANSSFSFENVMSITVEKERKLKFDLLQSEFNPLSVRSMVV
jgi:hypothetical protein